MTQEKISVIIPTYNRKNLVMRAVNSVINQKPHDFDVEIIVIDDASTDGTENVFKNLNNKQIKYYKLKKNKGVNSARNKGIEKSSGEWVLFLDSDDHLVEDAFFFIQENRHKLDKITFFGVKTDNGKKLYYLESTRKYSYKEKLENKHISGEFLPLVHYSVVKKNLFDEDKYCFEGFYWNKLIKKYGVMAFDVPLRVYHYDANNRVSIALMDVERAEKRFYDYKSYIEFFGSDYKTFKLSKQYSLLLLVTGLYAAASGRILDSRKFIKQSLKEHISLNKIIFYLLTYFGTYPFKKILIIKKRLVSVGY